ncbi:hypothetical protein [Noviherbaspirillum sedimenti]|nr:hypothetical protein [Noviherbaspirillum sedimenti]
MKKQMAMAILGVSITATLLPAQARNVKYMVSIPNTLESEQVKAKLDGSVKLFFGPQAYANDSRTIASMNAHGKMSIEFKADIASCQASFADALGTLQNNAKAAGADAVVNIVSYFKNGPVMSSATEFECRAGSNFSHVMLKGELVKLSGK